MTNEEAIELLKNMHWSITTKMNGEVPSSLALDMAIKALEQPTITHEQAIDYLHETGWLQNHDRILTESKMMMPVQPIIYCEKCLYKKICSWKNQGAEFCSFGERGKVE